MPTSRPFEALWAFDRQRQRDGGGYTSPGGQLPLLRVADPFEGVLGVDEVGRGALMGPVVAGAVWYPETLSSQQRAALAGVTDSKALDHTQRETFAAAIRAASRWGLGACTAAEVDAWNIHRASLMAFCRALEAMAGNDDAFRRRRWLLLVDGRHAIPPAWLKRLGWPHVTQQPVIKGDARSAHIASASILAKTWRDQWVQDLDAALADPYAWGRNVGYATPTHRLALQRLGMTPLHRRTFLRKILAPTAR
jgi:ribonuclease HII